MKMTLAEQISDQSDICRHFTSNKSYGNWGEIFGDPVIASAVLDRILHHCTTINIKGDSYRLKERRKQEMVTHCLPG